MQLRSLNAKINQGITNRHIINEYAIQLGSYKLLGKQRSNFKKSGMPTNYQSK